MTETEFIFIVLLISLACVLAFTTLVICNGTQQALYDFKKEFRRFRDGEQYSAHQTVSTAYHCNCKYCGKDWWANDPFPHRCPFCNGDLT